MADVGADLYHRFLKGDKDALERLVRLYSDELVRYACRFMRNVSDAEDVMEDTFATLLIKRKRFTESAPFKCYLFRIAHNKCVDRFRKNAKFVADEAPSPNPERDALKNERDETIYRCLEALPKDYGEVLHLVYLDGFSLPEAEKILRKSRKQVYNLVQRAKSALRQKLEKEGIFYEDL